MVAGYVTKTWLSNLIRKSKEDDCFETLIRGVGRMKCLRIILENMYKELKITQKKLQETKEAKIVDKLIPSALDNITSNPKPPNTISKTKRLSSPKN